eukprot:1392240-Amorphochlora_amoeboformis.AAC.1
MDGGVVAGKNGKYVATLVIRETKEAIFLGEYDTFEDATRAHDRMARCYERPLTELLKRVHSKSKKYSRHIKPDRPTRNNRNKKRGGKHKAPIHHSVRSKYVGVNRQGKSWRARINSDGKSMHIGTFRTEKEAAR